MQKILLLFFLPLLFLASGCNTNNETARKQELLLYCDTSLAYPMRELADIIEQRHNCIIKISKQGSGALMKSLEVNMVGDLFLPGSDDYIAISQQRGWIRQSVELGLNRAVLVVRKGNPLGIKADVHALLDPRYRVVLGSAESGSIGLETRTVLSRIAIYQQAIDNTFFLASDAQELTRAVREGRADLALSWYATTQWQENKGALQALSLDDDVAPPRKLILSLLTFSLHPDIGRDLMTLAASEPGRKIFERHGFH